MFHGSMVALVTPLKNDEVDVEALRALVEFHIQHETSAIIAAGTTGEAGTLSYAEKCLVIKTVVDAAKERIPVIAGTAVNSTKACIELTEYALSAGAHGALIMTPAYIKPTQEGLFQHYTHIANRIPMPIIPYNVPHRTGCDLLPETVIRLAAHSNIIGIKEATGQSSRLKSILDGAEGRLDVYSGDDLTAAEWMLAGAKGVISVTANIVPRKMAKLSEAALDGQRELCISINEKLAVLNELLFVESNPIPTKWAMARLGLIHDEIRLPLTPLSAIHHAKLAHELLNLGLLKS